MRKRGPLDQKLPGNSSLHRTRTPEAFIVAWVAAGRTPGARGFGLLDSPQAAWPELLLLPVGVLFAVFYNVNVALINPPPILFWPPGFGGVKKRGGVNNWNLGVWVWWSRGGQLSVSALLCLEGFCLKRQAISNEICFSED